MNIFLYNTKTKKKESFSAIHTNEVRMYHCGPTVYNFAHIGNLRAYVFADTLRRMFEWNNFTVKQVINIT
ncbi:MAG: cysteine--tRNA ligase, partial [Minisyncoccia bacterium]